MANKIKLKHPATFSITFIPIFAEILQKEGARRVLDPMAGTGKLADIKSYGFDGFIYANELETEWTVQENYPVDAWTCADAAQMPFRDGEFDAIVTSPAYGNRFADHHSPRDASYRISYTYNLGRNLHPANTGRMQWGPSYREKSLYIYLECKRVLKPNGLFVVNISNHIRNGKEVNVAGWTHAVIKDMGFQLEDFREVKTPRLKYGKNSEKRVQHEVILVMRKK